MTRWMTVVCAFGLLTFSGELLAKTQRALPPHAVGAVRKLLDLRTPLDGGALGPLQLSASIERDRIAIVGKDAAQASALLVTLVHPDDAPAGAKRLGSVALITTPGPAPEAALQALRERLEGNKVTLPWVVIEAEPEPEELAKEVPRLDLTQVDRRLDGGDSAGARMTLQGIPSPESLMELAALALRWRLAGEPVRAKTMTEGKETAREAHEVLALRLARGDAVSADAVLAVVPADGACPVARLSGLLRRDRAFELAARLAEAVIQRDPACVEAHYEGVLAREMNQERSAASAQLEAARERFPSALMVAQADAFLRARRGDLVGAWQVEVRVMTRRLLARGGLGVARDLWSWFVGAWQRDMGWLVYLWAPETSTVPVLSEVASGWCPAGGELPCLNHIPGGTFWMGAQSSNSDAPGFDPDASEDEGPVRKVSISTFFAMETEVDVRSFTACVRAGACPVEDVETSGGYFNYGQPLRSDYPVNGVSWFGAERYCAWIGARLPTEAEWEYLARGAEGRRFPWGDALPACDVGGSRRVPQGCPRDGTGPPGLLDTPSAMGMNAMGGGVWEWVQATYAPYAPGPQSDPADPTQGRDRVQRGGAWTSEDPLERRASYRASMPPETKASDVGFRCVRSAP